MKKYLLAFLTLIILLPFGYAALWHYGAHRIQQEIDFFWNHSFALYGVYMDGEKPVVHGFPYRHRIFYAGGVYFGEHDSFTVRHLEVKAFPLPGQIMQIRMPSGFYPNIPDSAPVFGDKNLISADRVEMDIRIPRHWPQSLTHDDIEVWQARGGSIRIPYFLVEKNNTILEGEAHAELDDTLQPAITLQTKITDPMAIVEHLYRNAVLLPMDYYALRGVSALFTRPDPETQKPTAKIELRLHHSMLYVGPAMISVMPEWVWPQAQAAPDFVPFSYDP